MTKRITAILLCIITLLLAGCSAKTEKPEAESTTAESTTVESTVPESTTAVTDEKPEEPKEDIMSIIDVTRNTNIKITLPEGNEFDGAARDFIVNEIKSKIFRVFFKDIKDLTVELKAEDIYTDGSITSIAFTGYGNVKNAAHPINMCLPINYDANTAYTLGLADIYHINDEFTRIVETYALNTFGEARSIFEKNYQENLKDYLNYADTPLIPTSSYQIYSHYSKDYVTVVFEVIQALGGHVDVKIPKSELESFLITESDTAALLDSFKANAESDSNAKWLSAFFSGDFNTCASMIGAEVSALAMLCTVEFGSVRMREVEVSYGDNYTTLKDEITFTVTESQFKSLPIGKYTYRMTKASDSLFNVGSWERLTEAVDVPEDAMAIIAPMIFYAVPHNVYGYTLSVTEKELFDHGTSDLIFSLDSRLGDGDGMMTADEFSASAKELFGLDSWKPNEKYASETDGLWAQTGHGGVHSYYDVTRVFETDDKLEVHVQVYGDYMSLSRSHTVKFTLAKTDSIYGYRFDKIEYTDKGDCEPFRFMI
ncbi:MAG: hypothetical protein IJ457_02890 [Clostridia bacterium]|nr:hypothetical protein [Clostridia bacterium]